MKNIRSYQTPSLNRYPSRYIYLKHSHLKIGIAVLVCLVLIISGLFYALVREGVRNRKLLNVMTEANKKLELVNKSLGDKDLQKAFGDLHAAQKQMVALLVPPSEKAIVREEVPQTSSVQKKALPAQVSAGMPDLTREIPYPFLFAGEAENLLLCEKETTTLYVFRKTGGKLTFVKAYPCLIGANHGDKRKGGDLATPVGVYFFLKFIPGKSLAENYGYGAFVLNYPNFLDRKVGKDGAGIWLHGHSAGKSLGDEVVNTRGCIVVSNDALKEMSEYLKPNGTAIAIVDKLTFTKAEKQEALSKELTAFVDSWKKAWESRDVQKYMGYYAPEFVSADGMSYQAFKRHKEKVNKGKSFISVATDNLMILLPPEGEGKVAVARFHQRYQSSNFKTESNKILYLKKGQGGWHIIGESSF
jgi:murein L,D-transpeptidase YafK